MNNTLNLLYGSEVYNKLKNSHIFMVGVGGIGCELLKVLAASGFRKLTILDLDTIEMTNLNRQFYFRREHVGMSKALVGKESIMKKHPELEIEAIHASIFEERFDIEFYLQFDLVFSALDNAQAREHLSKMCIKAQKIMIDSGTGGFSGQSNISKRFFSMCNNCSPSKPAPSYAICTIRASPSEPIHCVTFAIALYNLMYGVFDEKNFLAGILDLGTVRNIDKSNTQLLKETGIKIFNILFDEQIRMGLKSFLKDKSDNDATVINKHKYPITFEEAIKINDIYTNVTQNQLDYKSKLQPFKYYAYLFVHQFVKIIRSNLLGTLKFDKDDWDSVKFVAAVTNIRTYNFTTKFKNISESQLRNEKLKYLSVESVRQLGGKIIPAIASTNSIAASLETIDAYKIISNQLDKLRGIWITPGYEKLSVTYLSEPSSFCQSCSKKVIYLTIYADFNVQTFKIIIDLANIYGIGQQDINTIGGGTVYGKENREMIRSGLNELNEVRLLKEFNKNKPYSALAFVIYQSNQYKTYFWEQSLRFEFTVIHKEGLKGVNVSQLTRIEDTLKQLKEVITDQYTDIREERRNLRIKYRY